MTTRLVGGVDLGATNLRAAVADGEGEGRGRVRTVTPGSDGEAVSDAVIGALEDACEAAGVVPAALSAVGVGSIGPLDRAAGVADDPPNVDAERIPLVGPLEATCDCDVVLVNDCVAGAIGERYFADGGPDLAYVTLSTGVGAGAIVDGNPLQGHRGNAAEMGHVVVEPGGRECGCGGAGHWEAYAGGRAVPEFARELERTEGVGSDLDLADLDPQTVFESADPLAERVRDRLGTYNALGVAATVHAFDPAAVVLGGAIAVNNPDAVLAPVRDRLPALLAVDAPPVRLAALGEDAVLKGAVAAALTDGTGDPDATPNGSASE
ncbi:MAG: ROK family protein [Haloarculaceae archaeon]